jgi:hypothetical protein
MTSRGDAGTDQCHCRRYVEAVGRLHMHVHIVLDQQLIVDVFSGRYARHMTRVRVWTATRPLGDVGIEYCRLTMI